MISVIEELLQSIVHEIFSEREVACTWFVRERAVVSNGVGSVKLSGRETAWALIGLDRKRQKPCTKRLIKRVNKLNLIF